MIRKKRGITAGKQYILGLAAAVGVVSALWCQSFVSLADATGTITTSSATIRKDASTNSTALGSVSSGTTVSITDEVQDSSGTLWYQVSVNGQTGYIRSDLMSKVDDGADSGDNGDNGNQRPPGATVEPDTVLDAQYAVISTGTANVRTTPSANGNVVDKLSRDDQVVVGGESQGSDGMTWYYVTFTGTVGSERSGFIRSDLLSLGEMVPVPEEEMPEPEEIEPEPVIPANDDYELHYDLTDDGSYAYYIYNYADPEHPGQIVKYKLEDLMQATKARSESAAADAKTLVRQRVVIVALILLAAILIGVIVIMAFKLRDVYYEDDEDDDEEEVEEETPVRRRRRTEEAEEAPTRRRQRTKAEEETPARRRRRTEEAEEASARRRRRTEGNEETPTQRRRRVRDERETNVREVEYHEDEAGSAAVKTAPKRKPKNFLVDDDEFEFEFLNMDDKG